MKKNLLGILALSIIAISCSQQKFAFRKTVKVDETEQLSQRQKNKEVLVLENKEVSTPEPKVDNSGIVRSQEIPTIVSPEIASAELPAPDLNVEKEWKKVATENRKITPKGTHKTMGDGGGLAIAGFVLSLAGLFVAAIPFGVLAIIFGAIALKSSRRGLAIAAIIIGVVDIFFGLILISRM